MKIIAMTLLCCSIKIIYYLIINGFLWIKMETENTAVGRQYIVQKTQS